MSTTFKIRPLVITEGKTDWMHLKAAFLSLSSKGFYQNLEFEFYEYEEPVGMGDSELYKICETASKFPNYRPIICIFDNDTPEILAKIQDEGSVKSYKSWRFNVFSFPIPIPDHRVGLSKNLY